MAFRYGWDMQQTCRHCQTSFDVPKEDLAFLQKLSPVINGKTFEIPPPTLCVDCRQQRRLSFRNERSLYKRTCNLTKAPIISAYAPDAPYTVYEPQAWWSDQWDALSYGRDIDWNKPFFEQFRELQKEVPRIALITVSNENADYINWSAYCKNCYLLFAADYDEDCLYGTHVIKSRRCVDTLHCFESESCYEVVDCEKCNGLSFSRNCSNCSDGFFLSDCKGCTDCILCANLRSKKHHIRNKKFSPDEYRKEKEKILTEIKQGKLPELQKEFQALSQKSIHRAAEILNSENVSGDYLSNSRNLRHCFDVSYGEDCAYTYTGFKVKDLMDFCHVTEAELSYECMSVGFNSYHVLFCTGAWSCRDCYYSDAVHASEHLFGCIGLRNKKHCILNKQYSKEQYESLIPKLIDHMQKNNEYGEFFPSDLSPFPYNDTLAQEFYPLSATDAKKRGFLWQEHPEERPDVAKVIPAAQLPSDIAKIPDDILNWAIECEATKRPFRIVKQELQFYREQNLPIPHFHPDERHRRRMLQRNPRKLYRRNCANCKKEMETTYSPDRSETIFCEECYLKEVY